MRQTQLYELIKFLRQILYGLADESLENSVVAWNEVVGTSRTTKILLNSFEIDLDKKQTWSIHSQAKRYTQKSEIAITQYTIGVAKW